MEKITIANTEYVISEPTFAVLDSIKQEVGFDVAVGLSVERTKELVSDLKRLPKLIAMITQDNEEEGYDEKKVMERESFF